MLVYVVLTVLVVFFYVLYLLKCRTTCDRNVIVSAYSSHDVVNSSLISSRSNLRIFHTVKSKSHDRFALSNELQLEQLYAHIGPDFFESQRVPFPKPKWNESIRYQLFKLKDSTLINIGKLDRNLSDLGIVLSAFREEYLNMDPTQIKTVKDWVQWVDETHCFPKGWEQRLDYKSFLEMFHIPWDVVDMWCNPPNASSLAHKYLNVFIQALVSFRYDAEETAAVLDFLNVLDFSLSTLCWDLEFIPTHYLIFPNSKSYIPSVVINFIRKRHSLPPVQEIYQVGQSHSSLKDGLIWMGQSIVIE